MILTGSEIKKQVNKGNIGISDFDDEQLNPNSYNLKLHNELYIYKDKVLDMKEDNPTQRLVIPEEGLLMQPGILYLGRTVEYTKTSNHIPMLEGRSSIGRLGINIHATAGFGDLGFSGYWTLELSCIQPVRIYPNVEVCQIYYHTYQGNPDIVYNNGKYQNNKGVQASKLYEDFKVKEVV